MTIPMNYALEQCSEFSRTVEPYLPQLHAFPKKLLQVIGKQEGIVDLYLGTNPLITGFVVSLLLGAVYLVAAELTGNYSQVDRCWSLLPTLYVGHFNLWARLSGLPRGRLDLAFLFSTLWSIRLTWNYYRKGGYGWKSEDYRWEIVRKRIGISAFRLLNMTFISFIQSVLLYALATPAYILLLSSRLDPQVKASDLVYFFFELGFLVVEFIADQQQWDYQTAKQEYQKSAKVPQGWKQEDLDKGFVTSGLWAFSRHPNFAAEQSIWFMFYQWSCFVSNSLFNWTGAGCAFLILLFQSSTLLTESITSGKYKEYSRYQNHVGMFVPTSMHPYETAKIQPKLPKVIKTSEIGKKMAKKK